MFDQLDLCKRSVCYFILLELYIKQRSYLFMLKGW